MRSAMCAGGCGFLTIVQPYGAWCGRCYDAKRRQEGRLFPGGVQRSAHPAAWFGPPPIDVIDVEYHEKPERELAKLPEGTLP